MVGTQTNTLQQIKLIFDSYFQPLIDLISYLTTKEERKTITLIRHESAEILRISTKVMTRAICFNQGAYLEYMHLASEKHRLLKDELARGDLTDPHAVQNLAGDLVNFMNKKFYEAAQENFALMLAYFSDRSQAAPRICIKGNFRIGTSDRVVTVFRAKQVAYSSSVEIGKNSGFSAVRNNGKYFLENDIPSAAAEDKYFNPRLDNELVRKFASTGRLEESTWIKCWPGAANARDAYQSTLIIPMTLWNNQISDEFRKTVKIDNVGRTIFGYLCFDHTEKNFFKEEVDVPVGYAFADLLSMYLFSRTVFIEVSRSYEKAIDILETRGLEEKVEKLDKRLIDSMAARLSDITVNFDVRQSLNNDLHQLDEQLLKFADEEESAK